MNSHEVLLKPTASLSVMKSYILYTSVTLTYLCGQLFNLVLSDAEHCELG